MLVGAVEREKAGESWRGGRVAGGIIAMCPENISARYLVGAQE